MEEKWDIIIKPKTGWFELNIGELLRYRDLIYMFVKRSFTSQYKQTILGPLWFIISPLLTTFVSTIVFGNIAGIQTDGVPYFLFHLCGYTLWSYFSTCVSQTASTFTANAPILGKVYFPRLVMPISTVMFSFINTGIIFVMTIITMVCYAIAGIPCHPNAYILTVPILFLQVALLGLGFGIIISALTTKYRDLIVLISFGLQLWMYATPVVYPVSQLTDGLKKIVMLNPVSPIINNMRYAMLGCGTFEMGYWIISLVVTFVVLIGGMILFNKVEKTFMDTV